MDRFTPMAVLSTCLLDIGLNTLMEPISAHISVVILLTCLQVALPMCALVFLFVMFMRTKLLQAGNFGALIYKFRWLFFVTPIYLSFLIAIRAMRIEAYARSTTFPLLWDMRGYYQVFIVYRIVSIFFHFLLLRTLFRLGDPELYLQRMAPEIDDVPDFCTHVNERQFRAVPAIIRGSITLESLNHCVAVLNRLVVDKYQLLSLDQRELMTIKTSEKALAIRKQWESQRWSDDSGEVDVFSDQDFSVYPEMDGIEAQTWREVIQVLKHMNLIAPVKTTRAYTLLANEHCSADVQNWAQASADRLRKKLREGVLSTHMPYVKDGPGAVAGILRSKLRAKSPARVSFA